MPIQAFRAKQSTNTSGTGTLALLAAATNARGFQAAFGASATKVRYVISTGSTYEIGVGTFDGGSPGTLTRDTVLASSAGGSLVSLAAGTADVFTWLEPADRRILESAATSLTLALADLGNLVLMSAATAATVTLPSIATLPPGAGYEIAHAGSGALTVLATGADTFQAVGFLSGSSSSGFASITLQPGDRVELRRIAAGWAVVGVGASRFQAGGQVVAGGSALVAAAVAASAIDLAAGSYFHKTATAALTWTIAGAPPGRAMGFILELTNGGAHAQTWPGAVKWPSGTAPSLTASGTDVLVFLTRDGGTTWRAALTQRDSR